MNILLLNGHGGNPYDPGATGNGQTEAVLTRELADMVVERLKKYANVYRYPKGKRCICRRSKRNICQEYAVILQKYALCF